jgi:hypothetical protein
MADGAGMAADGYIRREDADQVLIASLVCVATSRIDTPDQELAVHLIGRALPLASRSSRIEALRGAAEGILSAWPYRRKRGDGAVHWVHAHLDLCAAIARDAIRAAKAKVGAQHAGR